MQLKPEQDFVEPQPEAPPPGAAAADTAVPIDAAARDERRRCSRCPRVHDPSEARARAREALHMLDNPDERTSTGRRRRTWRSRRSSPTGSASA